CGQAAARGPRRDRRRSLRGPAHRSAGPRGGVGARGGAHPSGRRRQGRARSRGRRGARGADPLGGRRSMTLRVLVVDDERLFAELMRVALANADDIEVAGVVHDAASAIAKTPELRPTVVLSDYHLPDATGADVARALRKSAPNVSVLVLTGDPSE